MKKSHTVSMLLASLLLTFASAVHAQTSVVKMDRDTFLSMFRWNEQMSDWVLKSGMVPPAGVKSREEIIGMREAFLSMNVWSEVTSEFEPVKGGVPRVMSSVPREQIQRESLMFHMLHRYDEPSSQWIRTMK
jgi:hypothetical protein